MKPIEVRCPSDPLTDFLEQALLRCVGRIRKRMRDSVILTPSRRTYGREKGFLAKRGRRSLPRVVRPRRKAQR